MLQNLQKNFKMKEKENKARLARSLTSQNQLSPAAASGQNSVRGAASNLVFASSGNCKRRLTT